MIGKLCDGFVQNYRNSSVAQRFVDVAFRMGRGRLQDGFAFHNVFGYFLDERLQLERFTCLSAKGGISWLFPNRVLDGFNDGGVQLKKNWLVIPDMPCCECVFHRSVALLA